MLSSAEVRRIALEVGFDDCGVARADVLADSEYPLHEWLARGFQAGLGYMERNADKRMDPRLLVPGARSVICCVSAYTPPAASEFAGMSCGSGPSVAAYARQREYHKAVKDMLFALRARLGIEGKVCCDTVPIAEKHWAARAGLGWIGRHTLLVTPRWGTWVNLGEIVTTEECADYSDCSAHADFCSTCGRCVDACPNGAIAPCGQPMIDAGRCTAYYTTHHPQPLPPGMDARGYTQGCDICQLACPHNHKSTAAPLPEGGNG